MRIFREESAEVFGGLKVLEKRDYKEGVYHNLLTNEKGDTNLPRSDVLFFSLDEEAWFAIRPSGTEPKIKFYFSVHGENQEGANATLIALKNHVLGRTIY
jgi:phosphoglucomutase